MESYMHLLERDCETGAFGKEIVAKIKDDVVEESHIVSKSDKDNDLLSGMNKVELDHFIAGNDKSEYEVRTMNKDEYDRVLKQNRISRMRASEKSENVDPLAAKAAQLNRAEKAIKRISERKPGENGRANTPEEKMERRAAAYKKMLESKRSLEK